MRSLLLLILLLLFGRNSYECTTAVISGKATKDGRPLLWKHRDTESFNNKMIYVKGRGYNFVGLINSQDDKKEVWGGTNSEGFSIINSASYNLKPLNDKTEKADQEGILMYLALEFCATVQDFQNLLDTLRKPLGVESNFGIIDAHGGAVYFEVDNFQYKKYDANDPKVAPNGYLIRTNFSFSGRENEGKGYNRQLTANKIIEDAYNEKNLSPYFFLDEASLCLKHELTKTDLTGEFVRNTLPNRLYPLADFILRYISSSTLLVQGVKQGESPLLVTTWIKLGFQPTSVSIPIWVETADNMPSIVTAEGKENAELCEKSLKLKKECFPFKKWAEGESYVYLEKLGNRDGSGYMQITSEFDREFITRVQEMIAKWYKQGFNQEQSSEFYKVADEQVRIFYKENFEI